MSEADPDLNTALLLGEIRGQLRELIHTGNNNASKIDAMATRIGALELAIAKYDALSGDIATLKGQVAPLVELRQQQKGALNLFEWFVRNWPAVIGFVLLVGLILRSNGRI